MTLSISSVAYNVAYCCMLAGDKYLNAFNEIVDLNVSLSQISEPKRFNLTRSELLFYLNYSSTLLLEYTAFKSLVFTILIFMLCYNA